MTQKKRFEVKDTLGNIRFFIADEMMFAPGGCENFLLVNFTGAVRPDGSPDYKVVAAICKPVYIQVFEIKEQENESAQA